MHALSWVNPSCPDCQGKGFGFEPKYWICRRCAGWGAIDPRGEAMYAAAAELAEHAERGTTLCRSGGAGMNPPSTLERELTLRIESDIENASEYSLTT
jgi:hypothetical protein